MTKFYRNDRERASAIAAATLTNGGTTLLFDDDAAPTSGYVVGGASGIDAVIVPLVAFGSSDVFRFLRRIYGTNRNTSLVACGSSDVWGFLRRIYGTNRRIDGIGTWVDDGKVYLDAVNVFADKWDALAAGDIRGEQAIYDVEAGKSLPVN